jgi:transposase
MSKPVRRHYSAEDKVKILRLHLLEGKAVSDVCDQHGLHPSVFYQWQRQFFENGPRAFEPQGPGRGQGLLEKQVATLQARLTRKHEVLSELMEEHIRLKKELGES